MKKKIMTMMLAAVVAGTLAGCSGKLSNEYVTVNQYKGLEVSQVEQTEVTDEQVEQTIQTNLQATAEKVPITDRAAEMGDWVNIDFTGYLDGVAFENGSAQAQDLQLGSGGYIGASGDYAGFEEQIAGHQTGEEFNITVQFPEDYTADMAGKVTRAEISKDPTRFMAITMITAVTTARIRLYVLVLIPVAEAKVSSKVMAKILW